MYAKNYESWLAVNKIIAIIMKIAFLVHPAWHMLFMHRCSYMIDDITVQTYGAPLVYRRRSASTRIMMGHLYACDVQPYSNYQ